MFHVESKKVNCYFNEMSFHLSTFHRYPGPVVHHCFPPVCAGFIGKRSQYPSPSRAVLVSGVCWLGWGRSHFWRAYVPVAFPPQQPPGEMLSSAEQ